MAANSMGQYRYQGNECLNLISSTQTSKEDLSYKPVPVSTTVSGLDETNFKDLQIAPRGGFLADQDYLVEIKIPQDMNYSYTFELMLVKSDGSLTEDFQYIKTLKLSQGGTGSNIHDVVLYETSTGEIAAMVPLEYQGDNYGAYELDLIYVDKINDLYYRGNADGTATVISEYNHTQIAASWKEDMGQFYGFFQFAFRPILSGFTHLLFRTVRTAIDYNIQKVNEKGQVELGRQIKLEDVDFRVYTMNNLIPRMTTITDTLSRIGVWSHPDLLMMVNGEEIRITANGYYELDVLPITSLSIAAKSANEEILDDNGESTGETYDYQDFFTIDYEYEIT